MLPAPLKLLCLLWQVRGGGGGGGCGGTPLPAQSGGVPGTAAAAVHQWKNCHPLRALQHCPHVPPPILPSLWREGTLQYHVVPFRPLHVYTSVQVFGSLPPSLDFRVR